MKMSSKDRYLQDCFSLVRVIASVFSRKEYLHFIRAASVRTIQRIAFVLYNTWQQEAARAPIDLRNKLKRHRLRIARICNKHNSKSDKIKALVNGHSLVRDLHTLISWLNDTSS